MKTDYALSMSFAIELDVDDKCSDIISRDNLPMLCDAARKKIDEIEKGCFLECFDIFDSFKVE